MRNGGMVELLGVTRQPSGGHSGSQITLSNLFTLLITPQLPTKWVLTFQHGRLAGWPGFAPSCRRGSPAGAPCGSRQKLSGPFWNSESPLSMAGSGHSSQAAFVFRSLGHWLL